MSEAGLETLPGFRRRLRITPQAGLVCSQLEDDYHCMSVWVSHREGVATEIKADMHRAPWTTCPGAEQKLLSSFTGLPLSEFSRQMAVKRQNCTHLFDLALLAASHAGDDEETVYDILVSDAQNGERRAEIRHNGEPLLNWREKKFVLQWPEEIAGIRIDQLKPWIDGLDAQRREAAKLLQWGNMLANGRSIPIEQQSDASKMPAGCYTFQPERAINAVRVGEIIDFSSTEARQPLAQCETAF